MNAPLNLDQLKKLVDGDAVAIRGKATLQPAGGTGDKVFPPTHSVDERKRDPGAKYAFEKRRLPDGRIENCVLLDSVQSQANRMEEALQTLWNDKKIALPVISVSFKDVAPDVGLVTSLSAPHRIADALLRDSLLDNTLFRLSPLGKSFTDASPRNAGPLFRVCPTALLFGMWDSTGPKGGLGAKFARSLSSEIVGIAAACGVKTASRVDPTGIVTGSGKLLLKRATPGEPATWTLDAAEAEMDGSTPLPWGSKKRKDGKWSHGEGKPSEANHSNVPPTIDELAGGVTIDRAEHTVVISLAALRRLTFGGGETEARTVLAALGLLAIFGAEHYGYDLRSRCLLVPQKDEKTMGAMTLKSIATDGTETAWSLNFESAIDLYNMAVAALPQNLAFQKGDKPLKPGETLAELQPSQKLKHLITESRKLAATGADIEEG
jgi:CRISPR-associated protein Csb1